MNNFINYDINPLFVLIMCLLRNLLIAVPYINYNKVNSSNFIFESLQSILLRISIVNLWDTYAIKVAKV